MRCAKGQVSTELMIIIGVILVVFIPLIVAMYFKTSEINNALETSQAQLAVGRMANIANSMGNLGGFAGPYLTGWVRQTTGSYAGAMLYLATSLAAAGILVLTLRKRLPADAAGGPGRT